MKKITLAFIATVAMLSSGFGQATYTLVAPINNNGASAFRPLNGTSSSASQRSVMFIHEFELLPMNLSTINSIGFQYKNGTGTIPVVGNFTLYLENTNDISLTKPNSFSGITSTLTPANAVYVGSYTVPAAAGAATVNLNLTTPFNYTGGGLYVMWDFVSAGPFAAGQATLASNTERTDAHWYNTSAAAAVNTFTSGVFRPALIFNAVNTATNEVEVIDISAQGKVSKLFNTPQNISTYVVNSSIGAQSSVSVALNITGANPYTSSTVIPNMAPGAITQINWTGYNPTNNGTSTISAVALLNDQNLANNTKAWTQSVSCSDIGLHYPGATFGNGYGFNTSGVFAAKLNIPTAATLTAINAFIGTDASNAGKTVYGVLADASGNIVANSTNTPNITPGTVVTLNFSPQALTGGTDYLFGIAQPTTGYFPAAYVPAAKYSPPPFYTFPLAGGAPTLFNAALFFGIEPKLTFPSLNITIAPSKTVVCKLDGPNTVTLTASGLTTYTWSVGSNTATSIAVTPTVSGTSGVINYSVTGTDGATGCKSSGAVISISVSACLGVSSNSDFGSAIKLFPNPAVNGKSTVSGLDGVNTITVFNVLGQAILTQRVNEESMSIDLSAQPSGSYLLKITNSDNQSRTIKIVNQN